MKAAGRSRTCLLVAAFGLCVGLAACASESGGPTPSRPAWISASPTAGERASILPSSSASPSAPSLSDRTTFIAAGATSNWTGFSWTTVSGDNLLQTLGSGLWLDLVEWDHGYAAIAGTDAAPVLVTSPDGEKWTLIVAVPEPLYLAAGPDGLIVVSTDGTSTPTIWTSADGTAWQEVGSYELGPIAGTSAGLVAISARRLSPTPSGAVVADPAYAYSVVRSTDGIHWESVNFEQGATWDKWVGVQVWSNGSRFFLTGSLMSGSGSDTTSQPGIWWSDDGRTWQRAAWTPGTSEYLPWLEFASGGMLAWIGAFGNGTGGGVELAVSHDGGRTWQDDPDFGPFGPCDGSQCLADGAIGSNGSIFLAVSGSQAWTSTDGSTWTPVAWAPSGCPDAHGWFELLPRGVLIGNQSFSGAPACYGAA